MISNITVTSNIDIYAVWNPVEYRIYYYEEYNGTYIQDYEKPIWYTIETELVTLPTSEEFSRTGYEFLGWVDYYNSSIEYSEIAEGNHGYIYLRAQWQLIPYTITYHENGGEDVAEYTFFIISTHTLNTSITRTGYTFEGWYDNPELDGNIILEINQGTYGDKDYYAKWSNNEYQINYAGDSGSGSAFAMITYGNMDASTNDAEKLEVSLHSGEGFFKLGYTLAGWQVESENGTGQALYFEVEGSPMTYYYDDILLKEDPQDNVYLTAIWEQTPYTVSYVTDYGIGSDTGTVYYDEISPIDIQSVVGEFYYKGYTLIGWQKPNEQILYFEVLSNPQTYYWNDVISPTAPDDIELTAVWEINNYTIDFDENGGFSVNNISRNYLDAIEELPEPTKNGYVFIEWRRSTGVETYETYDTSTYYAFVDIFNDTDIDNPNTDIVLVAKYKKILTIQFSDYNLTYNGLEQTIVATADGLIEEDTVNIELSYGEGITVKDAGDYLAIASLEDEDYILVETFSQEFTISPKQITVTFTDYDDLVYNRLVQSISAAANDVEIGDSVEVELSYGQDVIVIDADEYVASASINNNNYELTGITTQEFTIAPKELTINGLGTITKTFDGNSSAMVTESDYELNGIISPDTINLSFTDSFYNDENVSQATVVTVTGLSLDNQNYTLAETVSFDINGEILPLTINVQPIENQNKEYGENDPVLEFNYDALIGDDSFTGALSRDLGEDANIYSITIGDLELNDNYTINFSSSTFEITKKDITITVDENQIKVYGDIDEQLTYSTDKLLVPGDNFSGALARETGENVGLYEIYQHDLEINDNYNITFITNDFEIIAKEITVTVQEGQSKGYGTADPQFSYDYFPELITGDSFSGELTREEGEDVGDYEVQQGNLTLGDNYTIIFVSKDFNITLNQITVQSNNPVIKVYDKTTNVILSEDNYILNGILPQDENTIELIYTAQLNDENVGVGDTITVTNLSVNSPNYEVITESFTLQATIIPRDITVIQKDSFTKVYDNSISANINSDNYQFMEIIEEDDLGFTFTNAEFESKNVDYQNNKVIVTGLEITNTNYNLTTVSIEIVATITPKEIIVSADQGLYRHYGDAIEQLTYSYNELDIIDGTSFTGSIERQEGETPGLYNISQGSLYLSANYDIAFVSEDFEIKQRIIYVEAKDSHTKVYDGNVSADIAGIYQFVDSKGDQEGVIIEGDEVYLELYSASYNSPNVSFADTIIVSEMTLNNSNYVLANSSFIISGDIQPKPIVVTIEEEQSKIYGQADPIFNYQHTSLIGEDAFDGALSRTQGDDVGVYNILQGDLSLSDNYNLSFVSNTFEIIPKPITVTFDNYEGIVYDSSEHSITAIANDIEAEDTINIILFYGEEVTVRDAGDYTATAIDVDNDNYTLIGDLTQQFTIAPKILTVNGVGVVSKIYDGTAQAEITANDYQIIGVEATDTVSLTYTNKYYNNKNVEFATKVIVTGISIDNENYTLSTDTFDINAQIVAKDITVEQGDDFYKVYDKTDTAQITPLNYQFNDTVLSDTINLSYTSIYNSKDVEQANSVLVTNLEIDNNNYNLTTQEFIISAAITPKELIVTEGSAFVKTYDGNDLAQIIEENYNIIGVILDDDVHFNFISAVFNSKDVALADSVSVTGLSINNSNYNLVTSEFEISGVIMPKDIDIEQENAFTKVYDGTPIAVITEEHYRFVGVVSGDSVNLVFSSNSLNGVTKDNTTLLNITEMQIDNTNYNLTRTMLSISASITPKELQINVDIDQSKVYGSDDPIFSYNTDGLVEGDLFEGSLEREQGEDVGLYSINRGTLNPARASSYYITFNGEQFEITPKEITVSVDNNQSKIYGEADPESFTYQHTPLCFDDAFEGELSRVAGEAVGSYQIEQNTLSLNENYTIVYEQDSFVVNKKEIVISAISKQKTYGQIDPELEYSPIELVGDDTISGSLEREQGEDAASYDILIGSLQINDNYNINYVKAVFIINPKDIFVSVDSNQSKIYGEDDPILKYSSGELVGDDSFVGGLEREQGEDTGIYQINQGSLALPGGNYVINFNGGNFEITKRPIEINPNPAQKIYGDSDPEELLFELSEVVIESNELTGKLQRESGEDVGFYPITMGTISLGNNYEIIINYVEFEILPRPIEITAQNSIKTYGDMDGEFEYVISQGVLQGQDELTGSLSRDLGEDAGVYNITQGSLNNTNYDITFIGANLSIEQRAITVIADYIVKEYGATDPQLTYRVIDYTLPYGVSLNGELVRDEGEDAGIYTISQGTLNDENNPNYIINYIENNFKINQKKIYVRANDSFKYYGSVDPEFTYDVDGLGFGETLDIFSGNLEREQGEDEGDYDILIGSLTAQNYDIEYIKGTFTVLPEHFSIIYDANGGEGEIEEASGEFGDTIILSRGNGFIKTGNAIVGWALSSGGEVEYELGEDFVIDVEENTTLYAVWTIVSFNVNYNKNSSEATGSINMVTTQYQNVIALDDGSNLQREDYTLIGWNTKADNTGTFYNLSENFALPADNITFYAVWEINKCQVVYVLEDGQSIDTLNYDYYTKVTLHNGEDIEKQGYSIIGWSDRGNSLTVKYGFSQEIDAPNKSEFKIYPVWQLNTYLISYDIDGAEGQIDNQSVTYMDTIELSDGAGITKEGFTLTGWEFDNQTYDLQQSFQMPYSDVTMSAIWKRVIQYIVDDEVYDSGDYNDGDTAALIEFNQIREGYVFGGWSMLDGEQLSENEIIMDDNKTVYALWLPIDYNIEYVLNNGTLPEDYPDTYNIESELTLPIPKRDGYKFNGWYTNSEFAGEKVTSIPVGSIGDRKYYASFSKSELNAVDISLISISAVILVVGLVLLYLYLKKKKQKSN